MVRSLDTATCSTWRSAATLKVGVCYDHILYLHVAHLLFCGVVWCVVLWHGVVWARIGDREEGEGLLVACSLYVCWCGYGGGWKWGGRDRGLVVCRDPASGLTRFLASYIVSLSVLCHHTFS